MYTSETTGAYTSEEANAFFSFLDERPQAPPKLRRAASDSRSSAPEALSYAVHELADAMSKIGYAPAAGHQEPQQRWATKAQLPAELRLASLDGDVMTAFDENACDDSWILEFHAPVPVRPPSVRRDDDDEHALHEPMDILPAPARLRRENAQ